MKYPDITVQLTGTGGNVFSIIGRVSLALRRGGVDASEITQFQRECMSAESYDEALCVCMEWCEVE